MKKLLTKTLLFFCLINIVSCGHHHYDEIDQRYAFIGSYHVEESFYNSAAQAHESYTYDIDIRKDSRGDLSIMIYGYGNDGIYGTGCTLYGSVYDGTHIDIPINDCHSNTSSAIYEISGHGDISADGEYITFDLTIVRCNSFNCYIETELFIEGHRF